MLLVKKYPTYKIVNFDKLDYCASLVNIKEIADYPNYTFVKVRKRVRTAMRAPCRRCSAPLTPRLHCVCPTLRVQGDICSSDLVNYVLRTQKVDTIMNFAAQTHVDNSFGNSFTFTETNILGTHVLLEAAKTFGIKLFLHVSTDEVYGEGDEDGKASHEGTMLEPTNPYAGSKAGAEYLVKAYNRSFGLPIIITRGNNVYGPHQYPEKLIPKFINMLMRDMKL